MKSTFYINNFISNEPAQLVIEIGDKDVAFIIVQQTKITTLAAFVISNILELSNLLNTENLLQHSFSKIDVVYTNKESVLVPNEYFDGTALNKYIDLVYGNVLNGEIKTDFLYKNNIHTIYKIEDEIGKVIYAKFPFANRTHLYSLLPDIVKLEDDKLFVLFYQTKFVALCCKSNQLKLIQQFEYTNAEDVAYYLLAIVEQHTMNVNNLPLQLCGMIENNSNLYNELYKYFNNIEFCTLPNELKYVSEIEELPSHYFAHLFTTALCV